MTFTLTINLPRIVDGEGSVMQAGREFDGFTDQAFLNHLESLQDWKKRTLPLFMMPQGEEVVTWLMCLGCRPRPLKDLYANSRFSEPTVRIVVQSLVDRELVVLYSDESDQRVRLIQPSTKLVRMLKEYVSRIQAYSPVPKGRSLQRQAGRLDNLVG